MSQSLSEDDARLEPEVQDRLNRFIGVKAVDLQEGHIGLTQDVGPRFHDHRGQSILGSVGVLADACPGGALGRSVPPGTALVLSQVSATLASPFPDTGLITATGDVVNLDFDIGVGLAAGTMSADGRVVAVLQSRGILVSRAQANAEAVFSGDSLPIPPVECSAPAQLAGLDGIAIVDAIAEGHLPRGPLAGLLGIELTEVARGRVNSKFAPQDWMSSPFGSIQGGVLILAADLIAGVTAQTLTAAEQLYRALDLRMDFIRSPAIDGSAIYVEAEVVREGRRLVLIDVRLVDADRLLLARAATSFLLT